MTRSWTLVLMAGLLGTSQAPRALPQWSDPVVQLRRHIERYAGTNAIDCGQLRTEQPAFSRIDLVLLDGALSCAVKAAAQSRPFWLFRQSAGLGDSWSVQGLLGTADGLVFKYGFDSSTCGGSPDCERFTLDRCENPGVKSASHDNIFECAVVDDTRRFENGTGIVRGRIEDLSGSGLRNVNITAFRDDRIRSAATTDMAGHYQFPRLTPGRYTLEVAHRGHARETVTVTVEAERETFWNAMLRLAPHAKDVDAARAYVEQRAGAPPADCGLHQDLPNPLRRSPRARAVAQSDLAQSLACALEAARDGKAFWTLKAGNTQGHGLFGRGQGVMYRFTFAVPLRGTPAFDVYPCTAPEIAINNNDAYFSCEADRPPR